jgi:hypothetical protein
MQLFIQLLGVQCARAPPLARRNQVSVTSDGGIKKLIIKKGTGLHQTIHLFCLPSAAHGAQVRSRRTVLRSMRTMTASSSRMDSKPRCFAGESAALAWYSGANAAAWCAVLRNRQFDSSYKRNQPFSFPLGGGRVIQGWDKGFATMSKGEQVRQPRAVGSWADRGIHASARKGGLCKG